MRSGRRLLIVTLSGAASIDSAFTTAVRAERTPEDTAISGRGVVTMADVMLTIRLEAARPHPGAGTRVDQPQDRSPASSPSMRAVSRRPRSQSA